MKPEREGIYVEAKVVGRCWLRKGMYRFRIMVK